MSKNKYDKEIAVNFIEANPGRVDVWGVNHKSSDAEKIEYVKNTKRKSFDIRYYPITDSYMIF